MPARGGRHAEGLAPNSFSAPHRLASSADAFAFQQVGQTFSQWRKRQRSRCRCQQPFVFSRLAADTVVAQVPFPCVASHTTKTGPIIRGTTRCGKLVQVSSDFTHNAPGTSKQWLASHIAPPRMLRPRRPVIIRCGPQARRQHSAYPSNRVHDDLQRVSPGIHICRINVCGNKL